MLGDELRRARLEQPRYAPKPTGSEVAAFYAAYPDLLVRRVRVSPAPPWLAEAHRVRGRRGGAAAAVLAADGTKVPPLDPPRDVRRPAARARAASRRAAALQVRPAIVAALRGFERAQSFERWTIVQQTHALNRTICLRDQLPQPAAIDLTEYLPFLRIQ